MMRICTNLAFGIAGLLSINAGIVPASAQIANIAVTSAADYSLGVPSPGGIGALFCTGLSVSGIQIATTLPLPTSLAGVQVLIFGVPAPLYAVASVGNYHRLTSKCLRALSSGFFPRRQS